MSRTRKLINFIDSPAILALIVIGLSAAAILLGMAMLVCFAAGRIFG